jgi:hypothetical protein
MDNAGVFTLAAEQLGAAVTSKELTAITDLDGMTAVSLIAEFAYGSATTGATAIVKVQTSFDGGTAWYDVARFDFAVASVVKKCNLEGLLSLAVGAYAALSAEGVNDGLLGDRLRVVLTTTDTYSNTTLSVRASVR